MTTMASAYGRKPRRAYKSRLAVATGRLSAIVTWHSDRLTPAVWKCALERRMWDQLRAVPLNPGETGTSGSRPSAC